MRICKSALLLTISILFLFSCSPKIASEIHTSDTTRTSTADTTFGSIELEIQADSSEVIEFNALTFCDSLQRGLISLPYKVVSGKKPITGGRKIISTMQIDSSGKGSIICNEDWYKTVINNQATIHRTDSVTITNLDRIIKERSGYQWWKNTAICEFIILIVFIYFSTKKW